MTKKSLKLVSWGRDEFEKTFEFNAKVRDIKKDVREKYAPLAATNSIFKRWKIHILILIEIRSRIAEITSSRNLHLSSIAK